LCVGGYSFEKLMLPKNIQWEMMWREKERGRERERKIDM